jgi:hypothetical protein
MHLSVRRTSQEGLAPNHWMGRGMRQSSIVDERLRTWLVMPIELSRRDWVVVLSTRNSYSAPDF